LNFTSYILILIFEQKTVEIKMHEMILGYLFDKNLKINCRHKMSIKRRYVSKIYII
jgi:hypothetical protein